MEFVKAKCPRCGRSQRLSLPTAGQPVTCPACGQRFLVKMFAPPPLPGTPEFPTGEGATDGSRKTALTPGMLVALACITGAVIGLVILGGLLLMNRRPPVAAAPPPTTPPTTPVASSPPAVAAPPPLTPATVPAEVAPAPSAPAPTPASASAVAVVPPSASPASEPTTKPAEARILPVKPPAVVAAGADDPDLDEKIGRAIDQGTNYLLSQFQNGVLPDATGGEDEPAGRDALAVYAVLHAAQATDRPDLAVDQPLTGQLLDALKAMPMQKAKTTYDRSLRSSALGVYNRKADHAALLADAQWLEKACRGGGYSYETQPAKNLTIATGASEDESPWDNSNSQYGALGVWAAEEAGMEVPAQFWGAVRRHWMRCQRADGQWAYSGWTGNGDGRLSMTAAGLTMMLVAEDHLGIGADVDSLGRAPYSTTVNSGLAWMSAGDHAVNIASTPFPAYTLYGLERAGLASGLRSFGGHDWYRELAAQQVKAQQSNGSWGNVIDTAFNLLFLARGRHPILFDKLRFPGAWSNRPRDVANLTHFVGRQLEQAFNWQVVSIDDPWPSWMDAPVLFIASHAALPFTDDQVDKLREYAENGGLIFTSADTQAGGEGAAFNASVADLAKRLFPGHELRDVPLDDPIFRTPVPLNRADPKPRLQGVSNGSRLLMVHSPIDLGRWWQRRDSAAARPVPFQVGMDVFVYAAGKSNFRNKLRTPFVANPQFKPVAVTGLARVKYGANDDWNPEPGAAPRFARLFMSQTSIRPNVVDVDPTTLDPNATPMALLTGTGHVQMSDAQLKGLHDFVTNGGLLLVDACGGSTTFADDISRTVLPHAFGVVGLEPLADDHPILVGTAPGMSPVDPKLRAYAAGLAGRRQQPVLAVTAGRGLVLYCPTDVTTNLLGTSGWAINGYQSDVAYGLVRNALLYVLERP